MAQVLKDEKRQRIIDAAIDVFYQKDYRSATMQEIAKKADVPVGLIYSYYKNKQKLFDVIVQPVLLKLPETLKKSENTDTYEFNNFINIEKPFYTDLLKKHRQFIILIDKSAGTKHSSAKEDFKNIIEEHIKSNMINKKGVEYDDFFIHILASNLTESLLEIARHYKNQKWAIEMLDLVARHFYFGNKQL